MKPQTILVTGGAGYIGSHTVKALIAAGHRPVVLDNLSTGYRRLAPADALIVGDIADAKRLDAIFKKYSIDAVIHFAASSIVGESVQDPLKYYWNNVAKTASLLQSVQRASIRRFIFSSTAAVYGEPGETPIKESHPCRPTNPYGHTKLAIEQMLADCDTAWGLKHICLRYFNAAGADGDGDIGEMHDPETHLIPIVLQVAAGKRDALSLFGTDYPTPDGSCIRDYIHVSDLAQAHVLALEALTAGADSTAYNLGNSRGHSNRQVVETARRITGKQIPVIDAARRQGDPAVLVAASQWIRRDLDWRPNYEELDQIIETAWRWHQRCWK